MIGRVLRWVVPLGLFAWIGWRIDLARYWVLCAILVAWVIVVSRSVDPTLFRERFHPAGPTVDRHAMRAIRGAAVSSLVLTLADIGDFHWSDTVAPVTRQAAMIACVLALVLLGRCMIANRFFSSAIRLQPDRGHRVVHAGPYAVIRHPGYLAMTLLMPAIALALGSWMGLAPALIYSVLIIRRAVVEDRYLRAHLDGYADYALRVRFRLLPGVW